MSHQLPIVSVRRFVEGKRLWHDPRRRQCGAGVDHVAGVRRREAGRRDLPRPGVRDERAGDRRMRQDRCRPCWPWLALLAGCAAGKDAVVPGSTTRSCRRVGRCELFYPVAQRQALPDLSGAEPGTAGQADPRLRLLRQGRRAEHLGRSGAGRAGTRRPTLSTVYRQTSARRRAATGHRLARHAAAPAAGLRARTTRSSYPSIFDFVRPDAAGAVRLPAQRPCPPRSCWTGSTGWPPCTWSR